MKLPSSLAIVASVETSGVNTGSHGKLHGTTPLFDKEAERNGYVPKRTVTDEDGNERPMTDSERFTEKAGGTGTGANLSASDWSPETLAGEPLDTANVDVGSQKSTPAPNVPGTPDDTTGAVTGSEVTSTPQPPAEATGQVSTDEESPEASEDPQDDPETDSDDAEASDEESSETYDADAEAEALDKLTVPKLARLARHQEPPVEPDGTNKADFVAALVAAEVSASEYDEAWEQD